MNKIKHVIVGILVIVSCMGIGKSVAKADELKTTSLSSTEVKVYWNQIEGADTYDVYMKGTDDKKYKLVKTTNMTFAKVKVKNNKKYNFKVVTLDTMNEENEIELKCKFDNSSFVDNSHQNYTYSEMEKDIKQLCQKYSEYVTYDVIGKSQKGKKIYDVILGNPDASKTLLVISELHAREYVTTITCMKQLEYYLQNYNKKVDGKKPADIFKNRNVHYVMMANPDGVEISQNKKPRWKGNANGVNLNRNFPYKFKSKGKNTESYSGKKAASEKETKAIVSITQKLKKSQKSLGVISYHASGEIVFGSYHAKDKKLKAKIKQMYMIARKTTGYADAGSYDNELSNGCYREYLIYNKKIPCITIEVGSSSAPIAKKYYNSVYNKNKLVVLRIVQSI